MGRYPYHSIKIWLWMVMDGLWMTWGWFMDVDWVYHMSWLPLNIIEHPKSDVELGWLDTYEG